MNRLLLATALIAMTAPVFAGPFGLPDHKDQGTVRDFAAANGCKIIEHPGLNYITFDGGCALQPGYFGYGSRVVDPDGIPDNGDEYTVTDK